MKDQVTTIEQSKRLIEKGVPAEKASMVWQSKYTPDRSPELHAIPYQDKNGYPPIEKIREDVVPAFTVADLLEMIPKDIPAAGEQNHDYSLTLSHCFCWKLYYEDSRTHRRIGEELSFDLVDLLCNRIEWSLSNGYKLEV